MVDVSVVRGDITRQDVDAIVNAANNRMRGGGGVDGAIHRAAGPELMRECIDRFPNGLATGDAGWTTAGDLPCSWVIHTVGPNYSAGVRDRSLLESCYRRALEVADGLGARSVAFPLISGGIYGWPHADAIDAAVQTLATTPTRVERVRLVAFDERMQLRMRSFVLGRFPRPTQPHTIGSLFDRGVTQWGLRGDPRLWSELRDRFADTPLPEDWFTLRSVVLAEAEKVVGAPLREHGEPIYIAEFDPGHGMSAGTVMPQWWVRTGIPILIDRFEASRPD